jgi:hypothetical protein
MTIQIWDNTFRPLERLRTEPSSSEQYRSNPSEAETGNLGEPLQICVEGTSSLLVCADEATALLSVFRHLDLELLSPDDRTALLGFKSRLRDCFG